MRKFCYILLVLGFILGFVPVSFGYSFGDASQVYSDNARNFAKYYPQKRMVNRYQRPQKNYVFSAQQARYYGYRVPQQSGYYNPYSRGY